MSYAGAGRRIERQLDLLERLVAEGEPTLGARFPRVSEWSVGEQLDHVLLVLERGFAVLLAGGEALPRGINLVGRVLLAVGRLPRGVAKSPRAVLPRQRSAIELGSQVAAVRVTLGEVGARTDLASSREPRLPHPYFGGLTPPQGIAFLAVHTDHHLRIVADIRRGASNRLGA